ncbi:MAG TPA: hypothetical protein VMF58_10355 [Rhizomicrobium sp.]|nr:hypothetical protein [Rhizomicrobium sp.]
MRTGFGIAVVVGALGIASPALAQMGAGGGSYDDYTGGMHNQGTYDPRMHESKVWNDPETVAEELRKKGKCDEALPILRNLANSSDGYEISQYNLGLCLIDLAAKDPQHPAAQRKEGADYILMAANSGFGRAQAAAVGLYLDGTGVVADPVEAEKWALVYHDNGMRISLGLPDLPPDVMARLNTAVTGAKRAEAKARAFAWTPSTNGPGN